MWTITRVLLLATVVVLGNAVCSPLRAQALGTAFTYQGQLTESGQAATGLYDLQICLFDSPTNPVPISCAPDFADVPVEDGLFTLALDFGAAPFVGQQRHVELRVRPGASAGGYTILAPRQLIRAAPEALRASAAAVAPWSGLTGVPAGFADGIDNNSGGTVTSVVAGTGLSGGTITGSGTLSIANGGVGLAQIDTTQVQARITGSCPVGEYLRGIQFDGSIICESVQGYLGIHLSTTVDASANLVGTYNSLVIGADGLPIISYHDDTAGALKVAKCTNAACTGTALISTVDDPSNDVGEFTSIAIGTDALPVISYYDRTARALKVAKCSNAACTGAATITTVDDPTNHVGTHTDIAIGADGLPVISYHDDIADALMVAKCGNAACTAATISTVDLQANRVGLYTSITIGSDGMPIISYQDFTDFDLMVAQCSNSTCTGTATITPVDTSSNDVGRRSSIAIGSDGLPLISYYDATTDALKVAKCHSTACTGAATIVFVDNPNNDVGDFSSIAIGSDGLPVISYHDITARSLKVATCPDVDCVGPAVITVVDDPANLVGIYTSIAIGADGLPVISHFDLTSSNLKVSKCGTPSCQ